MRTRQYFFRNFPVP